MDTKYWKSFGEECPQCGSSTEVYTDHKEVGWAYNEDKIRCPDCEATGLLEVGEQGDTFVCWDD